MSGRRRPPLAGLISGFILLSERLCIGKPKSHVECKQKQTPRPAVKIYFPNKRAHFSPLLLSNLSWRWWGNFSHCTLSQNYADFVKIKSTQNWFFWHLSNFEYFFQKTTFRGYVRFSRRNPTNFSMSVLKFEERIWHVFNVGKPQKLGVCMFISIDVYVLRTSAHAAAGLSRLAEVTGVELPPARHKHPAMS